MTVLSAPTRDIKATHGPLMAVRPVETKSMITADGLRLDADIYRPETAGTYPVLLMRQAYGRRIGCTLCYAHPAWYAANGYIVVVQDIRGRGTSQGVFEVGENDVDDGIATVEWASQLDGSSGAVGMYGFSYQGYVQFMAACGPASALQAMAPAMAPWHARETWAYENGALRLQGALGWATQIAAETARHAGDAEAYAELLAESKTLNMRGSIQARPAYMERHRALSHYHRWLDTPANDPYWAKISPATQVDTLAAKNIPTFLIGGWFDTHLRSTWETYHALRAAGHRRVQLSIGPWLHFPWDRKVASVDFGPAASPSMDIEHIRFFDRWLKEKQAAETQALQLFDLGVHGWRGFDDVSEQRLDFALSASGRATIDHFDGKLLIGNSVEPGVDYIVNDPWRPSPSVGGAFGTPPGPVERSGVDSRGDVATFTSMPFQDTVTFAGAVKATLYVTSDAPSFDIGCVLARITKGGQVLHLTDGYCSVAAHQSRDGIEIPMRATCVTLMPGEALRLSLSAAWFPAYPLNPGTGEDPTLAPSAHAKVITLGIQYGEGQQSILSLTLAPQITQRNNEKGAA